MATVYEKSCKSILTGKDGSYTLNPYFGCQHLCAYCYARYLMRYRQLKEDWGSFVEVKSNAAEVLEKELGKRAPGHVMLSTACDPYQPLEEHRSITRACLERFAGSEWNVFILTKSALAARDLDVISAIPKAKLSCTITTFDETLRNRLEPGSSPSRERRKLLRAAAEKGIVVGVVLGPLLPRMTATRENIFGLFAGLKDVPLDSIGVDRLNLRGGVEGALRKFLRYQYPEYLAYYERFFHRDEGSYEEEMHAWVAEAAGEYGMSELIR